MKYLYKYGNRPSEIRRAKRELYGKLGLVLAALFFFAVMYLFARFQPRVKENQDRIDQSVRIEEEKHTGGATPQLRQQAESAYKQYQTMLGEGIDELEHINLLEQAIELQAEAIRSRSGEIASREDTQRLRELQAVRDEAMGEFLAAQSRLEEQQAQSAWQESRHDAAMDSLQKAINLQSRINDQYPKSSNRNASRLHQLSRKLTLWKTRPIAEEADSLLNKAYDLVAQNNYAQARKVIRKAVLKQKQLMQEYRNSSYASLTRMRKFEQAQFEINSAEQRSEITNLMETAESHLQKQNWEEAATVAERARILQREILQNPNSQDAQQQEILQQILVLKDTASSWPVYIRIRSARENTREALLRRDMELFQEQVGQWSRETAFLIRRFPKSRVVDKLNLHEVELLYQLRTEIPSILEMVVNNLVLVPGHDTIRMYQTEVNQALYESVTGENPSAVKDFQRPVDSVTWEEAKDFTRMLGTILAKPVSLPTKEQYMAALKAAELTGKHSQCWSSENSGRKVQKSASLDPNENGFYDLLGNVAEWLQPSLSGELSEVHAIGGSARDSIARLTTIPEELRKPDERNRFIGFRFVVDYREAIP